MRHSKPVRLENRTYCSPVWVGTVPNCADAVRLETVPTGGESVYLFLEFTIYRRHYYQLKCSTA